MNTAYRVWDGEQMHHWDDEGLSLEINRNWWVLWREEGRGCRVSIAESGDGDVLMWGTELKDKNGKLVYDGSVFKMPVSINRQIHGSYAIYEVVQRNGIWIQQFLKSEKEYRARGYMAGLLIDNFENEKESLLFDGKFLESFVPEIEVIGDVYQNPELLEGAE
ncbi:YopX family protein [Bacillus velezensis]|uniref:YopX family protein n=1 Tax=Bacillus velezensis TaxID=492670 RepID=UPI002DB93B18|nr:YopX family protein [Bacillus velezensis]MEC1943187.1 YopX family protein [Bacillus velezensis]